MRERLVRRLLTRLEKRTPGWIKSLQLQILMNTTARGFGVMPRRIWHHGARRALAEYAAFTGECLKKNAGDAAGLYLEALRTGQRVRCLAGFVRPEDCSRLVFYLYRNIDIHMTGKLPGEILVSDCFFGRNYSPAQCALMSAVDAGIIAGICGDGKLLFTERITEGCGRCRACFTRRERK